MQPVTIGGENQQSVYRLQVGPVARFFLPTVVAPLCLFPAGLLVDVLRRGSSSPLAFAPLAVVGALCALLLVKTLHFGDLSVSARQIRRTGNFGMVRTVDRAAVAKIVEATVIDSGRYGPTETKQLLLIGRDGRCTLIMSAAYDFDRLATELGVAVEHMGRPDPSR